MGFKRHRRPKRRGSDQPRPVISFEPLEARRLFAAAPLDNVPVTTDPGVQHQPSLAVDPRAPEHVVTAYMDYALRDTGYAGIGVGVSRDGGKTWRHTSIPLPAGFEQGAANPIAKFDGDGRLFVSFMAVTFVGEKPPVTNPNGSIPNTGGAQFRALGFTSHNGIFVARSDDGGITFNAPVAVATHHYDGTTPVPFDILPDLAIDTSKSSPNYGNVYVVWSRFYPAGHYPGESSSSGGSAMQIAVSSDAGASFDQRPPIRDTFFSGTGPPAGLGNANWPKITVGPGGEIYCAYYDFGNFIVIHSRDAARTFDSDQVDLGTGKHLVFNPDGAAGANTAGGPLHALRNFRTQVLRTILADPTTPGRVYVAEPMVVFDTVGREIDNADLMFARSDDYGVTWQTFQVNGAHGAINDDNGGKLYSGAVEEVTSRQFFSRLTIDRQGRIAAIWYDTRRDPRGRDIDVFASISVDRGQTFGPNFRVTNRTFRVEDGKFTNARGEESYYLGDFTGLALAGDHAYAAWTDTRAGNQDVFFAGFDITAPPPPPNDRYEPNDRGAIGTSLDPIVQRVLPRLRIEPGDTDIFHFQTRATGTLVIEVAQDAPAASLRLELVAGGAVAAVGQAVTSAAGAVVGQRLIFPCRTGEPYSLRVISTGGGGSGYRLDIEALTGNFGTVAHHVADARLGAGDNNLFLFAAAATGSLRIAMSPGNATRGALVLKLLDPANPDPLKPLAVADETGVATMNVLKGQRLLAHVAAAAGAADGTPDAGGSYALEITNYDAFSTPDRAALLFPAGAGPSQLELGDLNGDSFDDAVVTNALSQTVSVLLANGDGTFQAPRQFDVGAFFAGGADKLIPLNLFRRDLELGDFNNDGHLDAAVANNDSADVSILLGRGDGTFEPQRRFDATTLPFALDAGDLNNDGVLDLAVIDVSPDEINLSVLIGRGDGTFARQTFVPTGLPGALGNSVSDVQIADVDSDGNADLLYTGAKDKRTYVLLGGGDGRTFAKPTFTYRVNGGAGPLRTLVFDAFDGGGPSFQVADLNNDGFLDVVNAAVYNNEVSYVLGHGNGTFSQQTSFFAGQAPVAVRVADLATVNADGSVTVGSGDGVPDIITAGSGSSLTAFQGEPEITVTAGYIGRRGLRYVDPVRLATGVTPLAVAVGNIGGDAKPEVAFVDGDGIRVALNEVPDIAAGTSRNLGTVVHLLQPTLTITPQRTDAWYELTVPTEATHGAGHEVMDIRAVFESMGGAGLDMEVLDADTGVLLGSGPHVRISAAQGRKLRVHVFGKADDAGVRGSGAYTLDIAALPQLISVEANPLLPGAGAQRGGPTASVVLTFQGDRLDEEQAENPSNYRVIFLAPDGEREIEIGAAGDAQAVVYNPSANIDVTSGKTYPTAVRQTVTLLFDEPLPAGSYRVEVSPKVGAAPFSEAETTLIGEGKQPVVSRRDGGIVEGSVSVAADLVKPSAGTLGDFKVFEQGTPFLSQLHGDLGALLDRALGAGGDQANITGDILRHLRARLQSELGTALGAGMSLMALFLDPVGIDLADPSGDRVTYDLGSGALENSIANAFVSVASNVELIVVPIATGQFTLTVDDVPATARGGAVLLGPDGDSVLSFTEPLRDGQRTFSFGLGGDDAIDLTPGRGSIALAAAATATLIGLTSIDEVEAASPAFAPAGLTATSTATVAVAAAPNVFADVPFEELQTFDGVDHGGGEPQRAPEQENEALLRWWAKLNKHLGLPLPWLPQLPTPTAPPAPVPAPAALPMHPQAQPRSEGQQPAPPQRESTTTEEPQPPSPAGSDQVRHGEAPAEVSAAAQEDQRSYASLALLLPLWLSRRAPALRRSLRKSKRSRRGGDA